MNQEVQEVQHVEDDYLVPSAYEGQGVADANGIVRFTHENGKHYFTVEADDSSVLFRSEGYASVASRDNGSESFLKNKDNAKRYAIEETHGFFYVILKAGNNQEIARSCPYADMNMVYKSFGLLGTYVEPKVETVTVAPPVVEVPKVTIPVVTAPVVMGVLNVTPWPVALCTVPGATTWTSPSFVSSRYIATSPG